MTCTHEGCADEDAYPQVARDGEVWARLCPRHDIELRRSMASSDVKVLLRAWLRAQGGSRRAAARVARDAGAQAVSIAKEIKRWAGA